MLKLSESERDILQNLSAGMTPKEISEDRGVKCDTVYQQLKAVRLRNELRTTWQVIAVFMGERGMSSTVLLRDEIAPADGVCYSGRGLRAG